MPRKGGKIFEHIDPRMYAKEESREAGKYRQEVRSDREVELGLRAIAHDTNVDQKYRALARLLADDVFEIYTGQTIDKKHQDREKIEVARAFVDSRFDQRKGLNEVNDIMTKYDLEGKEGRKQAYKIRNGEVEPPKKASAVKAGLGAKIERVKG